MATKLWVGGVPAVAEVKTVTVNAVSAADVVGVSINGKAVSYTVQSGDTSAAAAAALQARLAASGVPEFAEVEWTHPGTGGVVTGTHRTPGTPYAAAAAGTAGAVTVATPTAATGPNHADAAGNWSGGTLPAAGDDVVVERTAASILHGLTAFQAVALASFTTHMTFTGTIGLPAVSGGTDTAVPGAAAGYREYRERFLRLGGNPAVSLGVGAGPGSPRVNLAVGTGTCTVNVFGAAAPADADGHAVNLINSGGSTNVLNVTQGRVGVATETGQTAALATVRVGSEGDPAGDAAVACGAGATLTRVEWYAGSVTTASAVPDLVGGPRAGTYTHTAGDLTAVLDGGAVAYAATGTLTVTARGPAAVVGFGGDPRAKALGTGSGFTGGAALRDPDGVTTWPAGGVLFDEASLKASAVGARVLARKL